MIGQHQTGMIQSAAMPSDGAPVDTKMVCTRIVLANPTV